MSRPIARDVESASPSSMQPRALRALLALRTTTQRVENAVGAWFLDVGLTPQKFGVLIVLHAEGKRLALRPA